MSKTACEVEVMKRKKIEKKLYTGDFETTVFRGQTDTKVWAAALVALDAPDEPESVTIDGNIDDFMNRVFTKPHKIVYFHNLKFDGSFILNWLLSKKEMKPYGQRIGNVIEWYKKSESEMWNDTYKYSISDKGMWYTITVKHKGVIVEFRDSLKLLPFSVAAIGKSFKTKHQKQSMEYTGLRFPNCPRTPEEDFYIACDVLVMKEALSWMIGQGHDNLTIGSCCMAEYKTQWTGQWDDFFPNLYEMEDKSGDYPTIGDYIRKSYHGGWCYCVPERAGKLVDRDLGGGIAGTTADVNSLYPSMMHSDSGNRFPIGKPIYFMGNPPVEALDENHYYFIRIKCHFDIKPGYLPTIQIKGNVNYPGRDWLTSSDIQEKGTTRTEYGVVELVLTQTDWEMLQKHYSLKDLEIIDGYYFLSMVGLFDEYINKYAKIKQTSKGAMRTLAKLFLNNLYGKFATSTDSSYKVCSLDEGVLKFTTVNANDKKPGYIPIGSAITSYARRFTITAAQLNYHPGHRGFIYADTDSIHCDLLPEEIVGAPEDPVKFNHWKYESNWDQGWFLGAKRYAERHTYEDREKLEKPEWDLKCAGMSNKPKKLFIASIEGQDAGETEEERNFVAVKRTIEDFRVGLEVPGMLKSRQIPGGVLLINGSYKMRPVNKWT